MDCVKFLQVICIFSIPLFASIYLIIEFQPDYYKYPKGDNVKDLKTAIFVALGIHVVFTILLTLWRARREKQKKKFQHVQVHDNVSIEDKKTESRLIKTHGNIQEADYAQESK